MVERCRRGVRTGWQMNGRVQRLTAAMAIVCICRVFGDWWTIIDPCGGP